MSEDAKVEEEVESSSETSRKIAKVRTWLRTLAPILLAVASSLAAYKGGDQSAKEKAGVAKDSAEAGYQGVDKWVHHLDETDEVLNQRIAKLEAEVAEIKRRAKLSVTKRRAEGPGHAAPPMAAPALPPPPPPLAPNLDKALEQIQAQQKVAPEVPPAAAPPK